MTTTVTYRSGSSQHERIIKHQSFRKKNTCFHCLARITEDSDIVVRHGRRSRYYHAVCAKRL